MKFIPPTGGEFMVQLRNVFRDLVYYLKQQPDLASKLLADLRPLPQVKTQYTDVVKSRQFLSQYQMFLKQPNSRSADKLLALLNTMNVLVTPNLLDVVPGYSELNSRLGSIPKVYTPITSTRL